MAPTYRLGQLRSTRCSGVLLLAMACGGAEEIPPPPTPRAPTAAPRASGGGPAPPSSGGPTIADNPLFSIESDAADRIAFFVGSLDRAAKPLVAARKDTLTASAALDTSRLEARGYDKEPALFSARLEERERGELALSPSGGECFTAVAHGGIGVMEIDAFIVAGDAGDPRVVATNGKSGPIAVVGSVARCRGPKADRAATCGAFCPKDPEASLRLSVIVKRGKGDVVVALTRGPRS